MGSTHTLIALQAREVLDLAASQSAQDFEIGGHNRLEVAHQEDDSGVDLAR